MALSIIVLDLSPSVALSDFGEGEACPELVEGAAARG